MIRFVDRPASGIVFRIAKFPEVFAVFRARIPEVEQLDGFPWQVLLVTIVGNYLCATRQDIADPQPDAPIQVASR
jgi:hypothetical protein